MSTSSSTSVSDSESHEKNFTNKESKKKPDKAAFSTAYTARELTRLLAYEEREAKDLQRALFLLTEQLNIEKARADQAEQNYSNALIRIKALNDARLAAQRDAVRANEELRLYKAQLDVAQKEIFRAQDVLATVDQQRYTAEEEAAKARSKVRKLHESELVRRAVEEGRSQGLEEGLERGRAMGFQQGKRTGYSQGREDAELELEEDLAAEQYSPPSFSSRNHPRHHPSASVTSLFNEPMPEKPASASSQRPASPSVPPTPPPEIERLPPPPRQPSTDSSSPTISQRSRISDLYQLDGWIPEASMEGDLSYIHIPAPHNLQSKRARSPPLPPLPLQAHTVSMASTSATTSYNKDADPPLPVKPHHRASSDRLRDKESEKRRKRRSSSESNSTTISELDILQNTHSNNAERVLRGGGPAGKTPLSVIEEVLSPPSATRTRGYGTTPGTGNTSLNASSGDLLNMSHPHSHRHSVSSSSSSSSSSLSSISTSVSQRLFHKSKPSKSRSMTETHGRPKSESSSSGANSLSTTNTIGISIQPPSQSSASIINVNATPSPNNDGYGQFLSPADADRPVPLPPSPSGGFHSPLYEPSNSITASSQQQHQEHPFPGQDGGGMLSPMVLSNEDLPPGFVPIPSPGGFGMHPGSSTPHAASAGFLSPMRDPVPQSGYTAAGVPLPSSGYTAVGVPLPASEYSAAGVPLPSTGYTAAGVPLPASGYTNYIGPLPPRSEYGGSSRSRRGGSSEYGEPIIPPSSLRSKSKTVSSSSSSSSSSRLSTVEEDAEVSSRLSGDTELVTPPRPKAYFPSSPGYSMSRLTTPGPVPIPTTPIPGPSLTPHAAPAFSSNAAYLATPSSNVGSVSASGGGGKGKKGGKRK